MADVEAATEEAGTEDVATSVVSGAAAELGTPVDTGTSVVSGASVEVGTSVEAGASDEVGSSVVGTTVSAGEDDDDSTSLVDVANSVVSGAAVEDRASVLVGETTAVEDVVVADDNGISLVELTGARTKDEAEAVELVDETAAAELETGDVDDETAGVETPLPVASLAKLSFAAVFEVDALAERSHATFTYGHASSPVGSLTMLPATKVSVEENGAPDAAPVTALTSWKVVPAYVPVHVVPSDSHLGLFTVSSVQRLNMSFPGRGGRKLTGNERELVCIGVRRRAYIDAVRGRVLRDELHVVVSCATGSECDRCERRRLVTLCMSQRWVTVRTSIVAPAPPSEVADAPCVCHATSALPSENCAMLE